MPYFEPSRPRPDSLTPPNGATSVEISPVVDADHAVLERLGDAPDAADVAGIEVAGEAEFGVVGHARSPRPRSRSGTAAPPGRRSPRARSSCSAWHVGEHGGLEEAAAERVALAADAPPWRPCATRVRDVLLDLGDGALRRSAGPGRSPALEAVADLAAASPPRPASRRRRRRRRPARRGGWRRRRSGRRCGTCGDARPPPRHRGRRRRTR